MSNAEFVGTNELHITHETLVNMVERALNERFYQSDRVKVLDVTPLEKGGLCIEFEQSVEEKQS